MNNTTTTSAIIEYATIQYTLILIPLVVLCLIIFLGNLLVIITILSQHFLYTIPNIYIISLAIADINVGIFIIPLGIIQILQQKWIFGKTLCHVWLMSDVCLCTVSIFHLCIIAIDRYRTITQGIIYMQNRTLRSTLWTILCAWTISLWISLPPLLGWHNWEYKNDDEYNCHLTTRIGYVIHSSIGSFIFPIFCMITLYIKIYYAIQKRLNERIKMGIGRGRGGGGDEISTLSLSGENNLNTNNTNATTTTGTTTTTTTSSHHSEQIQTIINIKQKFSLSRERKAAKTLGIIMGTFLFCWVPFGLMYIIEPFLNEEYRPSDVIYELVTWLGYTNSALNPIIYTIFSLDFRKGFMKVLHIKI